MTKALRTQFVIVDGSRARWVAQTDGGEHFATVRELLARERPRGGGQGVVFESATGRSAGVQEHEGAAVARRGKFPMEVAQAINHEVEAGGVDRLALVGPARTLGAVRRHLTGPAEAKLARTLAKDLARTPDHELGRWLRELEMG